MTALNISSLLISDIWRGSEWPEAWLSLLTHICTVHLYLISTCHRHKQSNTHVLQLSQRDHSLVMVADFYVSLHPSDLVYIFLSSLSPLSRLLLITHLLSPSFSLPFLTFNLHIRAYCRFQFNWASHKYYTKLQQTGLAVSRNYLPHFKTETRLSNKQNKD